MKKMTAKEFWELGLLQEVNRQFLHPLGLALEIVRDTNTGDVRFGEVWDLRHDPEGYAFSDLSDEDSIKKAQVVSEMGVEKAKVRQEKFGWIVQPIGDKRG